MKVIDYSRNVNYRFNKLFDSSKLKLSHLQNEFDVGEFASQNLTKEDEIKPAGFKEIIFNLKQPPSWQGIEGRPTNEHFRKREDLIRVSRAHSIKRIGLTK